MEDKKKATITKEKIDEVYNQIFEFFNRYYDKGDFYSKRRIGGVDKYAIPYNGEEVTLYWANKDQYYIKTAENFTNYEFKVGEWRIIFDIAQAELERNNVKGDKRYFFIADKKEHELKDVEKEFRIYFNYRPITKEEKKSLKTTTVQDKLTNKAIKKIVKVVEGTSLQELLMRKKPGKEVTILENHIGTYVKKNTRDYFIHKDLKGFLERELDFFLKNEILHLDDLERMNEDAIRLNMAKMRAVKDISKKVIAFLAQIEDFQKLLFEKKKLVLQCDYCMTLDNVPEEFYEEIGKNRAQVAEWKKLFKLDEITKDTKIDQLTQGQNLTSAGKETLSVEFLKAYPSLVLDTKLFNQVFKDKLFSHSEFINNGPVDEQITGLIINSENFQALKLINNRYNSQIKVVYIDPPYNSKATEILYKNEYRNSSWISLMYDRIVQGCKLLDEDGVFICAIDENEQERIGLVLDLIFPNYEKTCISIIHNPGGIQGDNFSYCHEYAYFIYPRGGRYIGLEKRDDNPDIRPLRDVSKGDHLREAAANCFYPIYVKDKKIVGFGDVCDDSYHPESVNIIRDDGIMEIYPIDPQGNERKWVFARNSVEKITDELAVEFNKRRKIWDIIRTKTRFNYKTVWTNPKYNANIFGSKILNHIMGEETFTFPKSLHNVYDCIDSTTNGESIIIDYFAGSGTTGHAVLKLNAEDSGNRKYILVEMGKYFEDVLKTRIMKLMFSEEWKNGIPNSEKGYSHIVKYLRLEQYEDTLNNIAFQAKDKTVQETLDSFSDYFIRYILEYETRESKSRISISDLENPFDYQIKTISSNEERSSPVDLVETFNYLLGLKINRVLAKNNGSRYYRAVYGENLDGTTHIIVWRSTKELDLVKDAKFINENFLKDEKIDVIFINGMFNVKDAKPIEPAFKRLMGA